MKKLDKPNLIMLICSLAAIAFCVSGILSFSATYQENYGTPRVENAVVDFKDNSGADMISLISSPVLSGEWEFFYNRWVVTDNDTGAADGMIHLPGRWTGMKINGERLPKTGFASYRLTINNLDSGTLNVAFGNVSNIPYRVFINGKLNVVSGTVSTDPKESFATGTRDIINWHEHTPNQTLTVVIETGYNAEGGSLIAPWLNLRQGLPIHNWLDYTFPYILLGGAIIAILFCFFLPVRALKKENLLSLALFLFALFLHYLVGADLFTYTFRTLSLSTAYAPTVRYITGFLLGWVHVYNLCANKMISLNRTEKIVLISVNAIAFVSYFFAAGTNFQLLPVMVSLLTLLPLTYRLVVSNQHIGLKWINIVIHTFLFLILTLESLDAEGLILYTMAVIFSIALFVILLGVVFLNFYRIHQSQKAALKAAQLETEVALMKNQTLKGQIKPHFVFNSLSAIQDIYRRDIKEGEEMLTRFAKHLRANVDSDNKDLVPFEEELSNMLNYFELENLRHEKKLMLILDVEHTDFSVPALSLQPFLENAVKYAETQDLENGHIQISTTLLEGGVTCVEISDNGKGFDITGIRENAVGIKNATERLRYGLDASVDIKSEQGNGTVVTISIPKTNGKEQTT